MKTNLPKRSLVIQERLDNITKEALVAAKDKICMIILFGSYARGDWVYDQLLKGIFPHSEGEQEEFFKLLQEAYIKGRYDPDYKISKEQLLYLIERVEELKRVTEKMCLARLAQEII